MAKIFDWKQSNDRSDIVHLVVQALVEGRLVALPVETGYHVFASGLHEGAVDRLKSLVTGTFQRPILFVRSAEDALDYVPDVSVVAKRLMKRGWPGTLSLDLFSDHETSVIQRLPDSTKAVLRGESGRVRFGVSGHEVVQQTMRLMPGPLVGVPMADLPEPSGQVARDLPEPWSSEISCLVNNGETQHVATTSVVQVNGNRCSLIQQGTLSKEKLAALSQYVVLFVCTGNTCRSPMAEALFRHLLLERFPHMRDTKLQTFAVASAGISAIPGSPASPQAQAVMQRRGLTLDDHRSRPLTEYAVRTADHVYTMTAGHQQAILSRLPQYTCKVKLLDPCGMDVADPFGGSEQEYEACARQIEDLVRQRVEQVEESQLPIWQ